MKVSEFELWMEAVLHAFRAERYSENEKMDLTLGEWYSLFSSYLREGALLGPSLSYLKKNPDA